MEEKKSNRGRKKKEIDGVFAERLSELLKSKKEQGIIQDTVANAIGVSRQALGKWANGETVPDILDLKKLANYFDVSTDYLLGLAELPDGDINLTKTSRLTKIPERTLCKLSEIYNDEYYANYTDFLIQNDVITDILEEHMGALAAVEHNNIIGYCLFNGGIKNVINDIQHNCKEISLKSIQDELKRECKRSYIYYAGEACLHLRNFFDNTSGIEKLDNNITKLAKEIYGYYLICVDNNNEIPVDSDGRYINEAICKEILRKLENEKIPCDDVRKDFKIFAIRENKEESNNGQHQTPKE